MALSVAALLGIPSLGAESPALTLEVGETNLLRVPTTGEEAIALVKAGAQEPRVVVVGMALPSGFDPAVSTPVLFTSVTGDPYRSNVAELEAYREPALARGWVVLTGQPHPWPEPERDTVAGREVSAAVAFRALEELFPGSRDWPTAFAGFSGGAKMAHRLAGFFLAREREVVGVFLSGCNEDQSRLILREYDPPEDALWEMAYFLSSGDRDTVSTPDEIEAVRRSLHNRGADRLRLASFEGPHALHRPHVGDALDWFAEDLPDPGTAPE